MIKVGSLVVSYHPAMDAPTLCIVTHISEMTYPIEVTTWPNRAEGWVCSESELKLLNDDEAVIAVLRGGV